MTVPWRRAIVVGASSGIGAAVARRLAAGGCRVAVVARRAAELEGLAAETGGRAYVHDVTDFAAVPALFRRIVDELGGLDLIVYAAGVYRPVAPDGYDLDTDKAMIDVNLLGAIAWLNEAARRFADAHAGTIVGISSVAGDRGRRRFPVYGTSKAGLDAYLEALRNRLGRHGVAVVTAKPGPVDTALLHGERLPFMISPDAAAAGIVAAAARRRRVAYVPRFWRPIMLAIRLIPSPIFQRIEI